MPRVIYAPAIQRHIASPEREVDAATVGEALSTCFELQPEMRSYILDDQGRLRKHVSIFIDGQMICDRQRLSDTVHTNSEIYVVQALSGG